MSKHTPGPWKTDEHHGNCYGVIAEAGVETVHTHGTRSISEIVAQPANGRPHPIDSQACANMRLIAAAPEMLELLVEIRKWIDSDFSAWDAKFVKEIDALLARAEGA